MATNRVLQLLRSNQIYANFTAAKTEIEGLTGHKDGEILLARYISSAAGAQTTTYETAIGVYAGSVGSETPTTVNHWTVFKSSTELDAAIQALQDELDATQKGAGLGTGGSYTAPTEGNAGYDVIGTATSLNDAINKIAKAIEDMDYTLNVSGATDSATTLTTKDASKVVTAVNQTDGQIAAGTTDAKDLLLTGYSKTSNGGSIAGTDTVETALSKLENATAAGTKISSQAGNQLHYLSTAPTDGLATKLSIAPLSAAEIAKLSDASNVREAYKLVDLNASDATAGIGDPIKIYKDSSLTDVFLGHVDDALNVQGSTYNKQTDITSGTGDDSLNFVYHLEDGTYSLSTVNVEAFLQESEFGNGLQVDDHRVSVKPYDGITVDANGVGVNVGNGLEIDSTSKAVNVKINSTNDTNRYLSVDANGVALNGNTIDKKIANAKTTVTTVAAGTETTADGTDFIKITTTSPADADGHVNYEISTKGIRDAIAVETTRAKSAETAIDSAVGLTKAANGEGRTYTSQVTLHGSEAAPTTVAGDINLLNAHVEALDAAAVKSVTGSNAININTASPADAKNPVVELILDGSTPGTGSELTGSHNALTVTNDGLFLSNVWDCGTY